MKKTIRLEAPDGGWGILVCFGMAMPLICILGSFPSFGLVFGDFLKSIGAETSAIAVIMSCFFGALSFSGLFVNSLFRKFSLRTVGIVGGIIYFIGSVMQVYVQTTTELLVAYGLVQGIAAGLLFPSAYTAFNAYFVKHRVLMMAVSQSLIGLGVMCYPVVMHKLNELFGFRGSLLVLAAINSHAILGMVIMQPVEWHMKRVEVSDDEVERDRSEPLMTTEERASQNSLDVRPNGNGPNTMGSYVSLGMMNGHASMNADSDQIREPPKKASWWQIIVKFLDLGLLKDPIYLNITLGMSFGLYSDLAFFTLQPMYLFELNYSKSDTANIIAIGGAADLISRIMIALSAIFVTAPSRHIYLAGAFFTFIARFAFLEVTDYTSMAIVTAIIGFFRTWIHITLPLVVVEYLPMERFASGYGLFMFLSGNITFLLGPFVGIVRDLTKNYVVTFHVINFFMGMCAFPWIIEIVYFKYCRKPKNRAIHD